MKFRQISIVVGILILIGAGLLTRQMMSSGEAAADEPSKPARAVQTQEIENGSSPAVVSVTGKLEAADKIEIYAEVQGRFKQSDRPFKEGTRFEKGETLVQIDKQEAAYNLRSQKSDLKNSITQMLPDLKIDYPEHYKRWQSYLENMDLGEPLKPLPTVDEGQVDYFISANNIYSLYNTIQAQQERLSDFTIKAPFDGILTEAEIDPGTLVRPGQKLGEFIRPQGYEVQAPIGASELDMISRGDSVRLMSSDINGRWTGRISLINNKINASTQSVQVTITVNGEALKEGMYLEGEVYTGQIPNSCQIPRRFVQDREYVWIVREGELHKSKVQMLHHSDGTAIVRGLEDGARMLDESIPTAYEGMAVQTVSESAI